MAATHKFFIYGGNSSYLLRDLLIARGNWEEVDDKYKATRISNFIWKPSSFSDIVGKFHQQFMTIGDRVSNKKAICLINHLQGNRCITTKTGILRSLDLYYKQTESLCKFSIIRLEQRGLQRCASYLLCSDGRG